MQLGGLHHITAITGNASLNVAFYTDILGLRLVKRTVNQDDVSAYHLFYGDETGKPGFDMTFFEWPTANLNRDGVGTVSNIAFGVNNRAALEWWVQRLDKYKVQHDGIQERDGRAFLHFQDHEGQSLELVDAEGKLTSTYWQGSTVPAEMAIQGFYAVRLVERDLEPSTTFFTETLGFRQGGTYQTDSGHTVHIFEVGPGGPGAEVHLEVRPDARTGRPGIGGVHHVAFRTPDAEEHRQWRERIKPKNATVTNVIDRFYFRSIYFREPGGVLFEIATDVPGFTTDEDLEHLGESLALPPFLEGHRSEIEANLRPIIPIKLASLR
ncbi:ring-cleaving dioxygenase [Ktedonospora formicarum]|uniref:Glyoxalase n=1 Tax=Ktedonospora formicarum TaxID=2778364 RepID=A0A8J3MUF7_9CHLR|nr:ring-cleaving dioxygenase [Ktedonospora formicarum]GHO46573.1 glyoxalase [Ktedonospora formicarum]